MRAKGFDLGSTYRTIKSDVKSRIASGEWPPGQNLPKEDDLAGAYGCARATVNRALRELAEEGVLERRRKSGTRVRDTPLREARFAIPVIRNEIEGRGAIYKYSLVTRRVLDAPDWLRARLSLAPGSGMVHLTCSHTADGTPFQFEDRWINLSVLPQAQRADFSSVGPNEWLIETIPFTDVDIAFSAVAADVLLSEHLGCAIGDALFQVERSTWFEGKPVTFVRLTYQRGYRMTSRY